MSIVVGAGKVCTGKVTEEFDGLAVVGSSCVLSVYESSEMDHLPVKFYVRSPFASIFSVAYTLKTRSVIGLYWLIHCVLMVCRRTKILISIIESISVNMIWLHTFRTWTYNFMHRKNTAFFSSTNSAYRYESLSCTSVGCAPIKFGEFFVAVGADESHLISRKRDYAVRWVKRLFSSVTLHVDFSHSLSTTEIVQRTAALSSFNYSMLGGA